MKRYYLVFSFLVLAIIFFLCLFSISLNQLQEEKEDHHHSLIKRINEDQNPLSNYYFGDGDHKNEILYECHGTCSCEQQQEERRVVGSPTIFTKGIKMILGLSGGLASIFIAKQKAKKYLQEICEEELSSSHCSSEIDVDDEDCGEYIPLPSYQVDEENTKDMEFEFRLRVWRCSGSCFPNIEHKSPARIKASKDFGCNKLQKESEVIIGNHDGARDIFMYAVLEDFCRYNSEILKKKEEINPKTGKPKRRIRVFGCLAYENGKGVPKYENPTVKCEAVRDATGDEDYGVVGFDNNKNKHEQGLYDY